MVRTQGLLRRDSSRGYRWRCRPRLGASSSAPDLKRPMRFASSWNRGPRSSVAKSALRDWTFLYAVTPPRRARAPSQMLSSSAACRSVPAWMVPVRCPSQALSIVSSQAGCVLVASENRHSRSDSYRRSTDARALSDPRRALSTTYVLGATSGSLSLVLTSALVSGGAHPLLIKRFLYLRDPLLFIGRGQHDRQAFSAITYFAIVESASPTASKTSSLLAAAPASSVKRALRARARVRWRGARSAPSVFAAFREAS